MILLVLYPCLIWSLAWCANHALRRRAVAFAVALCSPAPLALLTFGVRTTLYGGVQGSTLILWAAPTAYAAVIALVGAAIAAMPRTYTGGRCARCDYDLAGNRSWVCPECGVRVPEQARPAVLRAVERRTRKRAA